MCLCCKSVIVIALLCCNNVTVLWSQRKFVRVQRILHDSFLELNMKSAALPIVPAVFNSRTDVTKRGPV